MNFVGAIPYGCPRKSYKLSEKRNVSTQKRATTRDCPYIFRVHKYLKLGLADILKGKLSFLSPKFLMRRREMPCCHRRCY